MGNNGKVFKGTFLYVSLLPAFITKGCPALMFLLLAFLEKGILLFVKIVKISKGVIIIA